MEKIIQQSLFGPEMDILLNPDKTEKIIKKIKKPRNISEITTDKLLKDKNINFEDKLSRVTTEVERILGSYKDNTICIYSKEDFHNYITHSIKNGIISIDTETLGTRTDIPKPATDPFTCRLAGLCIYTPGQKNAYIPINHVDYKTNERLKNQLTEKDVREELKRIVEAKTDNIFQNGKFDYMVLYYTCGVKVPITWDTMIGAQILNENEQAGLKFQYKDKINPEQEKYDIDRLFDLDNLDKYPPELFALYSATDAFMTYELYKYQKKEFEKRGNERLYNLFLNIEMPVVTVCAEMQMRGIGLDKEFADRLSKKFHAKLDVVEESISSELEKYHQQINEWRLSVLANRHEIKNGKKQKSMSEKLSDPVEVTSPEQLGILLYDILELLKPDGDGKKPVDEATLLSIKDKTPLIPLILKKREYDKYLGTYIDALPKLVNPRDDRIHPKFNQLGREEKGVVTGRFSSTDPNFQNIPARGNITSVRCMMIPTTEYYDRNSFDEIDITEEVQFGNNWVWKSEVSPNDVVFPVKTRKRYQLCGSDFSAQEVKVFAQTCGDETMLKSLMAGKDLYSEVASTIYNMPYEECCEFRPDGTFNLEGKQRRTKSKSVILGLMYGRGNRSIAEQIKHHDGPVTKEDMAEAKGIVDNFFNSYPGAKAWVERMHKQAHELGYVEDLWGRRRRLPEASLPKYTFEYKEGKTLFNPLLGTADRELRVSKDIIEKYTSALDKVYSVDKRQQIIKEAVLRDGVVITNNSGFIATAERQSQNSPIQGGAATMTKIAMKNIYFDDELNSYDFHLLIPVHDELIGEAPLYYIEEAKKRMFYLMCNAGKPEFKLPMKCDGDDWSRWYLDVTGQHIRDEYEEAIKEGKTEDKAFTEVWENNCEFTKEQITLILDNNNIDV